MKKILIILLFVILTGACVMAEQGCSLKFRARWSNEKANKWYASQPWLVGCNFNPSTAINQLEMWQEESFDPDTIDKELGYAENLGMNIIRVYLHDLLWKQDSKGFLARMDKFLSIADKHKIKVMFVLLDSVWDPHPKPGKQREPKPHLHNSGWLQSPHIDLLKDPSRHDELEGYIKGVLEKFKDDDRVLIWDLYNEPDNTNDNSYGKYELKNKGELQLMLLKKLYKWAWEVDPSQPLTTGIWKGDWREDKLIAIDRFMLENSDIITYHNYGPFRDMKSRTELLLKYDKPMICSEYMARPTGSTFIYMLPYFKQHKIGAINWGFVAGKTQTQYPWDSWKRQYTDEPPLWFHEIFRSDGKPYDENEVEFIKWILKD